MTTRRDSKTKGGSVVTGYRMEPDLAQRMIAYARENFTDERGIADIARAARFLLRTQLGHTERDDHGLLPETSRGLKMEAYLRDSIVTYQVNHEMSFVGAARHLIRLALGYAEGESKRRERVFAELAEGRQGLVGG